MRKSVRALTIDGRGLSDPNGHYVLQKTMNGYRDYPRTKGSYTGNRRVTRKWRTGACRYRRNCCRYADENTLYSISPEGQAHLGYRIVS
jgi:hypothetical protein